MAPILNVLCLLLYPLFLAITKVPTTAATHLRHAPVCPGTAPKSHPAQPDRVHTTRETRSILATRMAVIGTTPCPARLRTTPARTAAAAPV